MGIRFEELGSQETPLGRLSLRRRRIAALDCDVYEIKLGGEYLMSSFFTLSERELGTGGIQALLDSPPSPPADGLDVVVGGLGMGYTAAAVLDFPQVRSLVVVELFEAVADWHRRGLMPLGTRVSGDSRCRMVMDDFFARAVSEDGFDPQNKGRLFDAVLVDIDHSPRLYLDDKHVSFYEEAGLRRVRRHLKPGGIFGIWSDDPPDKDFADTLEGIFPSVETRPVAFSNPLTQEEYTQTVYFARS